VVPSGQFEEHLFEGLFLRIDFEYGEARLVQRRQHARQLVAAALQAQHEPAVLA